MASHGPPGTPEVAPRPLSPEARRALAEADARRKAAAVQAGGAVTELGGRGGPDPTRYGDWERDGLAKDF